MHQRTSSGNFGALKECKTADELRAATRRVCVAGVKRGFGFDWSDAHERWLGQLSQQKWPDFMRELGDVGYKIHQAVATGQVSAMTDCICVWIGPRKTITPRQPLHISFDEKNETPARQVLPSGELGPVHMIRWDNPPASTRHPPRVLRQVVVERVIVSGLFCRCGELGETTAGRRPCRINDGKVEGLTLPDGTPLVCASAATDRNLATVTLLLAPLAHFRDALKRGTGQPAAVLEKEARAIKAARQALGLTRAQRGRPRRRS